MRINLVTTGYGAPAVAALGEAVRDAKADEPLAPVTVVVPSNHAGVTVRRLLARGTAGPLTSRGVGSIGLTHLTVHRLAELLGAAGLAAAGRRPVNNAVLAAAIRGVLAEAPGVFAQVAEHPSTEQALVQTYRELADLPAGQLDDLAGASTRAADATRIFRAARTLLAPGWYDEHDLMGAARATLAAGGGPALGQVLLYLPQELSRHAAQMLREVGRHHPTTVIAALTGVPRADRAVQRSLSRLQPSGAEGASAEVPAGPSPGDPSSEGRTLDGAVGKWPTSRAVTRISSCSDAEEEARNAVEVLVAAARDGTPLDQMAVLYPVTDPYARLLDEHLGAAGLPVNGSAVRSLGDHAYGRMLLQLLHLPDTGYRRTSVLDLLTAAPLRSLSGAPAPVTEWERLSREAGVVRGASHWDLRLAHLADRLELNAEESASEESAAVLRRRADRARGLRQTVVGLIDTLEDAARGVQPWRERVRWLRRTAAGLLGGEEARDDWPWVEQQAAGRVDAVLDRLATLDLLDGACSLAQFERSLAVELEADLGRTGRFGEGVLVAPLSFAVGLDLDLLMVVGLADGRLPAQLSDDSLLPDSERARTRGGLVLRREHADRQRRQLHAALASARRHVLTVPRGDLRVSSTLSRSPWVQEMVTAGPEAPRVEDQPSFAHRLAHLRVPSTEQDYRLRWVSEAGGSGDAAALRDRVLSAGAELIRQREAPQFSRFDGNVAGATAPLPGSATGVSLGALSGELTAGPVSATRLEAWATCPYAYFVRYVLGVEPVDDPDERFRISHSDRGALVHEVLEEFTRAGLVGDGPADERARVAEVAARAFDRYEAAGRTGRSLYWRQGRSRLLAMLDRFVDEDARRREANGFQPVAAELRFGRDPAGPVTLELPDGRHLHFRGVIDRLDVGRAGEVLVVDYKTGRSRAYRGLSPDNPDDRGTRLQLPVYGLAARAHLGQGTDLPADTEVRAEYWFLSERGSMERVGYAVTPAVLAQVGRTLATIVDGIGAGVFPARPTETATTPFVPCHYCNPDGLGVADRQRSWERMQGQPELAGYVALVEGNLAEDPVAEEPVAEGRAAEAAEALR